MIDQLPIFINNNPMSIKLIFSFYFLIKGKETEKYTKPDDKIDECDISFEEEYPLALNFSKSSIHLPLDIYDKGMYLLLDVSSVINLIKNDSPTLYTEPYISLSSFFSMMKFLFRDIFCRSKHNKNN